MKTFSKVLSACFSLAVAMLFLDKASAQPVASLTTAKTNAYELNPLNEGRFSINLSSPDASPITVNYSIGGTAVNGTDYSNILTSVTIPAASTNAIVRIRPINNNALDDDRTVILTLTSGTGYTIGSASNGTVTIFDDDLPAARLVYFQNFDTDDTTNWTVNVTSSGAQSANVFFDYSTVGIPPAPNSTNGTTRGLRLQANTFGTQGAFPGGVSVSPTGQNFTNTSYRLRFDAWINFNGPLAAGGNGSTHLTGAGVGTAGTSVQVAGSGVDSVFFCATGDGGSGADYRAYSVDNSASYQDGDPVYAATTRNNTNPYFNDFGRDPAPAAQLTLYTNQTGVTSAGVQGFLWHDVLITKAGDAYTWQIDGKLIATVTGPLVNPLGGGNILFNQFDINAGQSTDPNSADMQFGLIDNVRVETSELPIVTVTASTSNASEQGAVNGVFTLARSGGTSNSLTIKYALSGTAVNGTDYTALPGSVTLAAGATETNITLTPIDDSVSEFTETAILSIVGSADYIIGVPARATVNIVDNDPTRIDVSVVHASMYERVTNDYVTFQLERRGDLNTGPFTVNLTYSGTASNGVDFVPTTTFTVDPGVATTNFTVSPLDDNLFEGTETVTVNVASGTGYLVGTNNPSATGSILDDETLPGTVLFFDSLSNGSSSNNWRMRFMANNLIDDFFAEFGYDLSVDGIPAAPNGATKALKLTVNKFEGTENGAAGINFYPIGQSFSNNFALRFSLFIRESASVATSTEYALFGINHSGNQTNWFRQTGISAFNNPPRNCDGLWFGVIADASASAPGDFVLHTGNGTNQPTLLQSANHTAFTAIYKKPPYSPTDAAGVPANASDSTTPNWADVEVRNIGNAVTLLINNSQVMQQVNTTPYTNGTVMLGYCDPYESLGGLEGAAYFSNVRVVDLGSLNITSVQLANTNAVMNFTWSLDDPASVFNVQRASAVSGSYSNVSNAAITKLSPGVYQATAAQSGAAAYYRIRR